MENGSYAVSNKVLITGNNTLGGYGSVTTDICENGRFRKGPDMSMGRFNHVSVTLPNNDVALFGGCNYKIKSSVVSTCEVFDSKKEIFSVVGNMLEPRSDCAAVLLNSGVVMLIGGFNGVDTLNSCEFFDPVTKTFSECTAKMLVKREGHTASLLKNGKVLVCGGLDETGNSGITSTEIYNPATNRFTKGPRMHRKRTSHSATELLDGSVLICGGFDLPACESTEVYDAESNSFIIGTDMKYGRSDHFATRLSDGKVLIGGGCISGATTEIFDTDTGLFVEGPKLFVPRLGVVASTYF